MVDVIPKESQWSETLDDISGAIELLSQDEYPKHSHTHQPSVVVCTQNPATWRLTIWPIRVRTPPGSTWGVFSNEILVGKYEPKGSYETDRRSLKSTDEYPWQERKFWAAM